MRRSIKITNVNENENFESYLLPLPNCIDVAHNVKCQMTIVNWQMTTVKCHMSNVNCQMALVNCQISNLKCQMSDVNCQMTNVK